MLPNKKSYIDLDYEKLDAYGLPLARSHVWFGENDMKIFGEMQRWSREILEATGASTAPSQMSRKPITSWAAAAWAPTRAPRF